MDAAPKWFRISGVAVRACSEHKIVSARLLVAYRGMVKTLDKSVFALITKNTIEDKKHKWDSRMLVATKISCSQKTHRGETAARPAKAGTTAWAAVAVNLLSWTDVVKTTVAAWIGRNKRKSKEIL